MYTKLPALLRISGGPDAVVRDADRATIPEQPGNPDWDAYLAWKAEGNEPAEPTAPAVPPRTVEGRLLIKALTDEQAARLKLRDLLRITGDPRIPEDNGAVRRAAAGAGLDPAAWFDAAAASG